MRTARPLLSTERLYTHPAWDADGYKCSSNEQYKNIIQMRLQHVDCVKINLSKYETHNVWSDTDTYVSIPGMTSSMSLNSCMNSIVYIYCKRLFSLLLEFKQIWWEKNNRLVCRRNSNISVIFILKTSLKSWWFINDSLEDFASGIHWLSWLPWVSQLWSKRFALVNSIHQFSDFVVGQLPPTDLR